MMYNDDNCLWKRDDDGAIICGVCAHRCRVADGGAGRCRVRCNVGGDFFCMTYGRIIAEHVDPVEKKPLYHFLPSTLTYSVAAAGCNFTCDFCQNHTISQVQNFLRDDLSDNNRMSSRNNLSDKNNRTSAQKHREILADKINNKFAQKIFGVAREPQKIIDSAIKHKCESVSFTYTEPTVFFEYALDTAKLANAAGLKNIFVSNGYMTDETLRMIAPYLDACNIDLKSFRDDFYRERCGASLAPVLDTLKKIRELGIWLEVTTLVMTGINDSAEELAGIAAFIAAELGADTPWHVSRFFPRYRMSGHPITEISSIKRALQAGKDAGLMYVYGGNL